MQSAINNFIKNLPPPGMIIFISDRLLCMKFISVFQYASKIYVENNLFDAYIVSYKNKKFIIITTGFSFYLIAEILKSLQSAKNVLYIQSINTIDKINIISEAFIYNNERIKSIKCNNRFFIGFKKVCENNEYFVLSNSLTLPFDEYLNKNNTADELTKNIKIEILEFFNYYFYYYLNLNNISGVAVNVNRDISVEGLSQILNCIMNIK